MQKPLIYPLELFQRDKIKLLFFCQKHISLDQAGLKIILLAVVLVYILLGILMIELVKIININKGYSYANYLIPRERYISARPGHSQIRRWAEENGKKELLETIAKRYGQEIRLAARKHHVHPRVIIAIIAVEWDERGLASSRGAYGQMGLMPLTAKAMGVRDINDPGENIMGGVKYLSIQIKKHRNLDIALAAYNAGPGNVRKYKGIPPFKETRDYIERVKYLMING